MARKYTKGGHRMKSHPIMGDTGLSIRSMERSLERSRPRLVLEMVAARHLDGSLRETLSQIIPPSHSQVSDTLEL